jgi:hypothetical protein
MSTSFLFIGASPAHAKTQKRPMRKAGNSAQPSRDSGQAAEDHSQDQWLTMDSNYDGE